MGETKELLERQIDTEIQNLSVLEGNEKSEAVDRLSKLYKLKIEEDDLTSSRKTDRLNAFAKCVLGTAEIVLPLAFYGIWMKRGFKFEETGTFTSQTFRGLFNRFKPTK